MKQSKIIDTTTTYQGATATVHSRHVKHTSSLPKYHFTVQSSPVKDGTWTRIARETSTTHSGESAAIVSMRVLTSFVRAATVCVRAAKATQMAAVASQAAAAASALGIETARAAQ